MKASEIRNLAIEYAKDIYHLNKMPESDDMARFIGFVDCLDTLFPLVEALEKYTEQETYGDRIVGDFIPVTIAMETLTQLADKLRGE